MGWTSFSMHRPIKEWFKDEIGDKYEALDVALVKRQTLYAAVKNKETGQIFCAVFLVRWTRGYYNFSYKGMDEFCGPGVSDCPMRIIKLLSPLNDEDDPNHWARDWRIRVEKYHNDRKKIKNGVIKTAEPVPFTSGQCFQYFKKMGRRTYAGVIRNNEFEAVSRVRFNPMHYKFEII